MSKEHTPVVAHHTEKPARQKTYVLGFLISLALTLTTYLLVVNHVLSRTILIAVIITLALIQFMVQLAFFLHLGTETKPRWKFLVFSFMFMVVLIIVIGSLWIMNNLNYHTMSPSQLNHYLHTEEGI
jgi:cytochrome o ubiquinol oxidase operon protein cyoD